MKGLERLVFFRRWSLKIYFARRDGEIRFYPFNLLGPGWVVEESQVGNLENCLTGFSLGSLGLVVLWFLPLRHFFRIEDLGYLWAGMVPIYVIYWAAARFCARRPGGGITRVPDDVALRDMALAQSPARIDLALVCGGIMTTAGAGALIVIIGMSLFGLNSTSRPNLLTAVMGALFFSNFLKLRRVSRMQKQLGPHAETKAVFD